MSENFKNSFQESMNALRFSPADKERLIKGITWKQNKTMESEDNFMKKWTIGKAAAIAAAVLLAASGGAVYASGLITTLTSGASAQDYKYTYDKADQLKSNAGIAADIPERFDNGYTFDKAAILNTQGLDDTGSTIETWPEININYTNSDGGRINLSIENETHAFSADKDHTMTREIDGITVNYDLDEYVFLPPSVENTGLEPEMQERLENDPHFYVSYGSMEEEHSYFSNVSFVKNGVYYLIYGHDMELTAEDFFEMSAEIIRMD